MSPSLLYSSCKRFADELLPSSDVGLVIETFVEGCGIEGQEVDSATMQETGPVPVARSDFKQWRVGCEDVKGLLRRNGPGETAPYCHFLFVNSVKVWEGHCAACCPLGEEPRPPQLDLCKVELEVLVSLGLRRKRLVVQRRRGEGHSPPGKIARLPRPRGLMEESF